MELLKALAMPFQLASLLFVAMTSLMLALAATLGIFGLLLAIFGIWISLVGLTRLSFSLIDDAANGMRDVPVVSIEMLNPFDDSRSWVHPLLAVAVGIALLLRPEIPRLPVQVGAALLFPLSIGAIAISGRAVDALNPVAMARVLRGLAHYYVLAVLWMGLCLLLGVLVVNSGLWSAVRIAMQELLVLLVYAFIGGAIYVRRMELGFQPRLSPEHTAMQEEQSRATQRQHMIDGLYRDLRVRETARAVASARRWIDEAGPKMLASDVHAILVAGARWSEPRGFAQLLRSLVSQLLALRQPALAFAAVEAGLAAAPGFTPEQESDAVTMIRYALQTGRKRLAATLLTNFMSTAPSPGPELQELHNQLHSESVAR